MKIGFVTNNDISTESSFNIASRSLPVDSYNLLGNDATKEKLINKLNENTEDDVFVFTHGSDESFYDNENNIAYSSNSNDELKNRKIFVYACFTANILGKDTANLNSIYWGYTGPLAALDDNLESRHIFINVVSDILNNFSLLNQEKDIIEYLNRIKQLCEDGQSQLDIIAERNKDFDVIEGYKALMHIWSRLRIYFKSENNQLLHSESEIGDIF